MTTASQVKKLVQPLLARNPDLVLRGHWLLLKPVHHVLRGILIDRTSQARRFNPRWAVVPVCEPIDSFYLNWGAMLYRPGEGLWDWNDDGNPALFIDVVEREALPVLRSLATLADFVKYFDRPGSWWSPFSAHVLRYLPLEVARGNLETAKLICERLMQRRAADWGSLQDDYDRVADTLCPLVVADDRPGMARLLREWQAYTVKQLKLEAILEPVPFPLEMRS